MDKEKVKKECEHPVEYAWQTSGSYRDEMFPTIKRGCNLCGEEL